MGNLTVTDESSIDPYIIAGVHAVKVQINFLRRFFFGQ